MNSNATISATAPFAGYQGSEEGYDEFFLPEGKPRGFCQSIVDRFDQLGAAGLETRDQESQKLVQQSGANFRDVSAIGNEARPWQLAITPLAIAQADWKSLESGLQQRTRLLEALLQDILGPQRLIKERVIPADLLHANPEFYRAYHQLSDQTPRLSLTATDLARNNDGSWWVTGDRARAPSGLGYALENRVIAGRVFPKLLRRENVIRLASFFSTLQEHFDSLAPMTNENPRVAILTPGRTSYRYVEDAYLARYLGYTLVQGRDLAVRENRLNLKTLGGLLPIDVLWRHISDQDCDPLELNGTSMQGATGMLQMIRQRRVAVANALGSTLVESPAMLPFLRAATKFLFSEELILPSIATYWCGGKAERQYVLDHLDQLVLRPAFQISREPPINPSLLPTEKRDALIERIKAAPQNYVAQVRPARSTTPVWHQGKLHCWKAALRTFQLQTSDRVCVMPGGLARVSPDAETLDHSPTSGRLGQDCWIIGGPDADGLNAQRSPTRSTIKLVRSGAELPSRVAEHLYWLGRSAERAEAITRLVRTLLIRLSGEQETTGSAEIQRLVAALASMGQLEPGHAIDELGIMMPAIETAIVKSLFDSAERVGLRAALIQMGENAFAISDRISLDSYRLISGMIDHLDAPRQTAGGEASGDQDLVVVTDRLERILADLLAFAGLAQESITRTHGWRFLDLGRRLERAYQTAELLSAALLEPIADERSLLESVLQTTDSLMTYRSRYLLQLVPVAVIDLLVTDETNPRSIAFQLQVINRLLSELPSEADRVGLGIDQKASQKLLHSVQIAAPDQIAQIRVAVKESVELEAGAQGRIAQRLELAKLLQDLMKGLPSLSDCISARYLLHTATPQTLTGRIETLLPRLPG